MRIGSTCQVEREVTRLNRDRLDSPTPMTTVVNRPAMVMVTTVGDHFFDVRLQMVERVFQAGNQVVNVVGATVDMAIATVSSAKLNPMNQALNVVEQTIQFCQIVSQVVGVARMMGDVMNMIGNLVKFSSIIDQMAVLGDMAVMECEFGTQLAGLSHDFLGQRVDVTVRCGCGIASADCQAGQSNDRCDEGAWDGHGIVSRFLESWLIEFFQADKVQSQSVCQIDSWRGYLKKTTHIKYGIIIKLLFTGDFEGQTTHWRCQSDYVIKLK